LVNVNICTTLIYTWQRVCFL